LAPQLVQATQPFEAAVQLAASQCWPAPQLAAAALDGQGVQPFEAPVQLAATQY
jgi:hypothetical protein